MRNEKYNEAYKGYEENLLKRGRCVTLLYAGKR